jgi:hypothetical protein
MGFLNRTPDDTPRPPAAAYHLVASLLGDDYFLAQPPRSGHTISVIGTDGLAVQFSMSNEQARSLVAELERRRVRWTQTAY